MLRNDGLQDVEESVVFGKRVGCWGKLGGGADRKLSFRRRVGEKGEDVAGNRATIWKEILLYMSVEDAERIGRRTM